MICLVVLLFCFLFIYWFCKTNNQSTIQEMKEWSLILAQEWRLVDILGCGFFSCRKAHALVIYNVIVDIVNRKKNTF